MITVEEAKKTAIDILNLDQEIKGTKQQRESLEKKKNQVDEVKNQDVVYQLSQECGILAKQLVTLRGRVKSMKHQLAKDIIAGDTFLLLGEINKINTFLTKSLTQLIVLYDTFNTKLAEEIKIHYGLADTQVLHVTAKESGASVGFIVQANGHKYYVKESLSYREEKKINPKELFIYKLLDYTHFGPKTEFILKSFSTSRTGAQICYISTQDVEYSKTDSKEKVFTTDNPDDYTSDVLEAKETQWNQSLNNKDFRIELLALSILDDVFLLNDSLRTNPSNYGTLRITNGQHTWYKPKLIDHLPDCKNITFSYQSMGDAIQSLKYKLQINMQRRNHSKKLPPISFTLFQKKEIDGQDYFIESDLQQAYHRLLFGKAGKIKSDILSAVERAQLDIVLLIHQFPDSFVNNAEAVLKEYCDRIKANMAKLNSFISLKPYPAP